MLNGARDPTNRPASERCLSASTTGRSHDQTGSLRSRRPALRGRRPPPLNAAPAPLAPRPRTAPVTWHPLA